MASIAPVSQSYFATGYGNVTAGRVQANNQGRMYLGNVAGLFENPYQIAGLQMTDKAFQLQGLRDQTNFQVSQLMLEGARGTIKKNNDQRERLMGTGAIFV